MVDVSVLKINSTPSGAKLTISSPVSFSAVTPFVKKMSTFGGLKYKLELAGYKTVNVESILLPNIDKTDSWTLEKIPVVERSAFVMFNSNPQGAAIDVPALGLKGTTPCNLESHKEGTFSYTAKKSGYDLFFGSANFKFDTSTGVTAVLKATPLQKARVTFNSTPSPVELRIPDFGIKTQTPYTFEREGSGKSYYEASKAGYESITDWFYYDALQSKEVKLVLPATLPPPTPPPVDVLGGLLNAWNDFVQGIADSEAVKAYWNAVNWLMDTFGMEMGNAIMRESEKNKPACIGKWSVITGNGYNALSAEEKTCYDFKSKKVVMIIGMTAPTQLVSKVPNLTIAGAESAINSLNAKGLTGVEQALIELESVQGRVPEEVIRNYGTYLQKALAAGASKETVKAMLNKLAAQEASALTSAMPATLASVWSQFGAPLKLALAAGASVVGASTLLSWFEADNVGTSKLAVAIAAAKSGDYNAAIQAQKDAIAWYTYIKDKSIPATIWDVLSLFQYKPALEQEISAMQETLAVYESQSGKKTILRFTGYPWMVRITCAGTIREGSTPTDFEVAPGKIAYKIELKGYKTIEGTQTVFEGTTSTVTYNMEKLPDVLPTTLDVTTIPEQCLASIQSLFLQKVTPFSIDIIAGSYDMVVEKTGFKPKTVRVIAKEQTANKVSVVLEEITSTPSPNSGRLTVSIYNAKTGLPIKGTLYINDIPEEYHLHSYVLDMTPGAYNIRIEEEGYMVFSDTVGVQKGQTTIETIQLVPLEETPPTGPGETCETFGYHTNKPTDGRAYELTTVNGLQCWTLQEITKGKLQALSDPKASVWIAGQDTGKQTPTLIELEQGVYDVTFKAEGYVDTTKGTVIRSGETSTLSVTLKTETAPTTERLLWEVDVNGTPTGAKILVNGYFTDKYMPDYVLLEPGTYVFSVAKSGYKTASKTITLEEI